MYERCVEGRTMFWVRIRSLSNQLKTNVPLRKQILYRNKPQHLRILLFRNITMCYIYLIVYSRGKRHQNRVLPSYIGITPLTTHPKPPTVYSHATLPLLDCCILENEVETKCVVTKSVAISIIL